jgi:hypothetical protein
VLAHIAVVLAVAGGLIHMVVIRDHLEFAVVAVGFAVMATGQWVFALWMLTRPSRGALLVGAAIHAVIAAIWVLSRTTGLAFVPGAEAASPVGVADVVANTFSLGVVGVAVIESALRGVVGDVVLPRVVARQMTGLVVVGALFLSVPAIWAPHDHAAHAPHDQGSGLGGNHDDGPHVATVDDDPALPMAPANSIASTAEDHGHTHGPATAHHDSGPTAP